MKSLSLVLFWIALASCLFAQKEVVKKEKNSEKVVSLSIDKDDKGQRTVSVTTEEDGERNIIKWNDNGEIPSDVLKQLDEANIDISILDGSGEHRDIMIEVDEQIEMREGDRKKMIVIKSDEGGSVMELDWDGEGDMPSEMQKLLDEHDIDIDELHEEYGDGEHSKMKIRTRGKKDKDERRMYRKKMRTKAIMDGRRMNAKEERSYKIITKDDDGNEKVMEWTSDDKPFGADEDVHILRMDRGGRSMKRGGENVFFFSDDDEDVHLSDAYMGAQIESTDEGALILDVMKDSPADKAGLSKNDVVTKINGARARSMEGLLTILTFFDPDDQVELTVTRGGKEKKVKLTLGKRPDSYR